MIVPYKKIYMEITLSFTSEYPIRSFSLIVFLLYLHTNENFHQYLTEDLISVGCGLVCVSSLLNWIAVLISSDLFLQPKNKKYLCRYHLFRELNSDFEIC